MWVDAASSVFGRNTFDLRLCHLVSLIILLLFCESQLLLNEANSVYIQIDWKLSCGNLTAVLAFAALLPWPIPHDDYTRVKQNFNGFPRQFSMQIIHMKEIALFLHLFCHLAYLNSFEQFCIAFLSNCCSNHSKALPFQLQCPSCSFVLPLIPRIIHYLPTISLSLSHKVSYHLSNRFWCTCARCRVNGGFFSRLHWHVLECRSPDDTAVQSRNG